MVALVSGALLTGLVSTPHCIGMCGPFAATAAGRPGGTIAWTLGRMTTYAALGAAAGALSGFAATWGVAAAVVAGAFVLASAGSLAGLWHAPDLLPAAWRRRLGRRGGWSGTLLLGAATGLLPCGVVWGGLALAASAGGGVAGAAAMAAVGLGTLPAFAVAAVPLRRILGSGPTARRVAAAIVLLTGWGLIGWRVASAWQSPSGEPACHHHAGG